ncbi:MAG: hypothetical protein ACRBB0_10085 [Pelagimonas sp.]|uniref:hypothetical protein n=1 Tax=Pelagimonas sp. TaxID=2073170 RepID=UPI003D6AAD21
MIAKTIFATAIIALAGAVATPSHARGNCKDVYVVAENLTGGLIKVIDLNFMISGYGKKSEPIRNQDIPAGQSFSVTRNFEHANERQTQVTILYRTRTDNKHFNKWSGVKRASSEFQECKRHRTFEVDLRD